MEASVIFPPESEPLITFSGVRLSGLNVNVPRAPVVLQEGWVKIVQEFADDTVAVGEFETQT